MVSPIHSDSVIQNYLSNHHSYDELLGNDGHLRPHWAAFFKSFNQLGNAEFRVNVSVPSLFC